MTRRKVRMEYIENPLERKNTYKKRKQSVLRKTAELSTLCGIDACAIVYSSNDTEAQIWPSDDAGVKSVIERFRSLSKWEQCKYMVDKDDFVTQMIVKKREQVRKIEKGNKEDELTVVMYNSINAGGLQPENNLSYSDLNNLSSIIERNLSAITRRLATLGVNDEIIPNQQPQIQEQSYQTPQPQIQEQSYQTMVQIPDYQSQMRSLQYQNPIQTPAFLPQIQAQSSYQTLMKTPTYLSQMQTASYHSVMEASSSSFQAQFKTLANQNLIETPAFQPLIQNQSYQSQMEIPAYQPQIQTQPVQTLLQNLLYQPPQIQAQSYNPLMEALSSSSQTQLPKTSYQTTVDPPPYRPQMQAQPYNPLMEASSSSQPQLPNTSYQTMLDPPPYRPQMPTPALAAANTEEMPTQLNDGNAPNVDADTTSTQWIMDMLNDPVLPEYLDFPY